MNVKGFESLVLNYRTAVTAQDTIASSNIYLKLVQAFRDGPTVLDPPCQASVGMGNCGKPSTLVMRSAISESEKQGCQVRQGVRMMRIGTRVRIRVVHRRANGLGRYIEALGWQGTVIAMGDYLKRIGVRSHIGVRVGNATFWFSPEELEVLDEAGEGEAPPRPAPLRLDDRVRVVMLDFTLMQGWDLQKRRGYVEDFLPFLGRHGRVSYAGGAFKKFPVGVILNDSRGFPKWFSEEELQVVESCGARQLMAGDLVRITMLHVCPLTSWRFPGLGQIVRVSHVYEPGTILESGEEALCDVEWQKHGFVPNYMQWMPVSADEIEMVIG